MNQIDLSGRTAIVTGGAQGIGAATARRMVLGGAKVVLLDRDKELLDETKHQLDGEVMTLLCDVTNLEEMTKAHHEAEDRFGAVSILVHSAGVAGSNSPTHLYDPGEWRSVIDINLVGTFNANRVVIPSMIDNGYGRIVNIASVAGKEGNPNASAYSASKAGVIALTKSIGKELAQYDIAVNCITPAAARTRIFDQMSQEHIDYMLSKIPRGRFVEVNEIASMVAWLVSQENSFTTGAAFDLSGGRSTY